MKTQTLLLALAVCLAEAAIAVAADSNVGTWKLNPAKSKMSANAQRNDTVVVQAVGDSMKIVTDGKDSSGKATHTEWSGKFDGKDYPVTGSPTVDTRSYARVNDHTLSLTQKKDGKVVTTGQIVISSDGKMRTVTTSGTDPQGNRVAGSAVYDKQ